MAFTHHDQHDTIAEYAGEDLTLSQYRVAAKNGAGEFVRNTTAGLGYGGIIENAPKKGQGATVVIGGYCPAVSGGSFAVGAELASDNAGRLVAVTGAGEYGWIADEEATAANQIVTVRKERGYKAA